MAETMYRVPKERSNAQRRYGGDYVEKVDVKVGRKYFTDRHGIRYDREKKVNENGDAVYYEYDPVYSGDWLLFETEAAAKRHYARTERVNIIHHCAVVDQCRSLSFEQVAAICDIIDSAKSKEEA